MTRVTIVALIGTFALLLTVFELVRQRRLQERYSLLWLLTGLVLFVLAAWRGGLTKLSDWAGIAYPPSFLFVVAGAFFLVVLLHYSTVISRLTDQNTQLAQRLALLEERLRGVEQG